MKRALAAVLLFAMLAVSSGAFALPCVIEGDGQGETGLCAAVSATYDPLTGRASFTVLNTALTEGPSSGFTLGLPNEGLGLTAVIGTSPAFGWRQLNDFLYASGAGKGSMPLGAFALYASAENGAGTPVMGLYRAQSATFGLFFSGVELNTLSVGAILAVLANEGQPSQSFAMRFHKPSESAGEAAPFRPPLSAALLLPLGGLAGLLGFRRLRAA